MSLMYGEKNKAIANIYYQLTRNETLLKFLYYITDGVDILSAPSLTNDQRKKVWSENIFQEDKLPADLSTDVKCYVSLSYGDKMYHHRDNKFFNNNKVLVRVLCHKSVRKGVNGDRCNSIESCIEEMFEGGKIGTAYDSLIEYSRPIGKDDYGGFEICVTFNDFNGGR